MAEMPERPWSAAFQNSATPMPIGEMIASPGDNDACGHVPNDLRMPESSSYSTRWTQSTRKSHTHLTSGAGRGLGLPRHRVNDLL